MHEAQAKGILSAHNGMNMYRGCTHGCIYCDSRSNCYQFKHDFEDVEVKINAPELLEQALRKKRKRCMIGTGAMCDPYLPLEKNLKLTRRCLEIIDRYGFGLAVQTKSDLILRDIDLLKSINAKAKCVVQMTLTTCEPGLCKILEPGVCNTQRRAEVLSVMRDNGIPTVVWIAPILPFINDTAENIDGLLEICVQNQVKGIVVFDDLGVTMRDGNRQYFYRKLDEHFPGMKQRYIREFGEQYICPSLARETLLARIEQVCRQYGIMWKNEEIFEYFHRYEEPLSGTQLSLFD